MSEEPIVKDRDIANYNPFKNESDTLPTYINFDIARKAFRLDFSTYLEASDFENDLPRYEPLSQDFKHNQAQFDGLVAENQAFFDLLQVRAKAIAKLSENQQLTRIFIGVIDKIVLVEFADLAEVSTDTKTFSDANGEKFTAIMRDPANAEVLQAAYALGLKLGANPLNPEKDRQFFFAKLAKKAAVAQSV